MEGCSMCVGSLLAKPPKPPAPIPEDASVLAQRKRLRAEQQRDIAEQKQKQFDMRVQAYTGKQGRASLLTGRSGGQGFKVAGQFKTNTTLGV